MRTIIYRRKRDFSCTTTVAPYQYIPNLYLERICVCGSRIIPLSDEEARSWVESICSYDTYCKLFGEPEE